MCWLIKASTFETCCNIWRLILSRFNMFELDSIDPRDEFKQRSICVLIVWPIFVISTENSILYVCCIIRKKKRLKYLKRFLITKYRNYDYYLSSCVANINVEQFLLLFIFFFSLHFVNNKSMKANYFNERLKKVIKRISF